MIIFGLDYFLFEIIRFFISLWLFLFFFVSWLYFRNFDLVLWGCLLVMNMLFMLYGIVVLLMGWLLLKFVSNKWKIVFIVVGCMMWGYLKFMGMMEVVFGMMILLWVVCWVGIVNSEVMLWNRGLYFMLIVLSWL